MKTFRTLDLAIDIYEQAERLKITGHLRDQLLRQCRNDAGCVEPIKNENLRMKDDPKNRVDMAMLIETGAPSSCGRLICQ